MGSVVDFIAAEVAGWLTSGDELSVAIAAGGGATRSDQHVLLSFFAAACGGASTAALAGHFGAGFLEAITFTFGHGFLRGGAYKGGKKETAHTFHTGGCG